MDNVFDIAKSLKRKTNQLLERLEYLRTENLMLIEENVKLKQEIEGLKKILNDESVEGKGKKVKGKSIEARKPIHEKLDTYIHEIDTCIEWINTM